MTAARPPGTAPGYAAEGDKAALLRRLRRIEGQVRGLQRMVAEDAYCIDVLTQVAAVKRGLEQASLLLLDDHLRSCVVDAARSDDPVRAGEVMAEVTSAVGRLLRS